MIEIKPQDLRIRTIYTGGGGFAPVNTSGVELTHIPTGLKALSTGERSAHANKAKAMELLEQALEKCKETFTVTTIVHGCCNCPYNSTISFCSESSFDTPEEYEKLSIENRYTITDSCPKSNAGKLRKINQELHRSQTNSLSIGVAAGLRAMFDRTKVPCEPSFGQFSGIDEYTYKHNGMEYTFAYEGNVLIDASYKRLK